MQNLFLCGKYNIALAKQAQESVKSQDAAVLRVSAHITVLLNIKAIKLMGNACHVLSQQLSHKSCMKQNTLWIHKQQQHFSPLKNTLNAILCYELFLQKDLWEFKVREYIST